jgi:hypothetical protein
LLTLKRICAFQVLAADHVLENRVLVWTESEYHEGLSEDRVLSVQGKDTQVHVRHVRTAQEPQELLMHHLVSAYAAAKDRLVQHDGQLHSGFPGQHALALHAHPDKALDHRRRNWLDLAITADNVPRICLSLKQARYDLHMPDRHGCCFVLEANELTVIRGQAVSVLLPPASLCGVPGEVKQLFPACAANLVVVEQFLDFLEFQASPGQFIAADLGG